MKILYPIIKANSGADVYSQRLVKCMSGIGHEGILKSYPQFLSCAPFLISPLSHNLNQYDVIHSNVECGFAFKTESRPLIVTVHHLVFNPAYQKYCSLAQKLYHKMLFIYTKKSLRVADSIVAVSNNTRKEIERVFRIKDVQVIHNGIDTNFFRPMDVQDKHPDKVKLLFVGNLTKRKGADLLPEIMRGLDDRFIIYYTLGLRTKKEFSDSRMIPLGVMTLFELVNMYNFCDIVIVPSRLEGFGYSAAEAMACGKPIVATNCSSLPELVTNEKGGFLCEMDDINDFIQKIKTLANDDKLRRQMGKYNREKVLTEFDVSIMSAKYNALYEKLI
jgi:glycosyltransferase involved in cell wall biosynthesis